MFKFRLSRGKYVPDDEDDDEPIRTRGVIAIKSKRSVNPQIFGGGTRQQHQRQQRQTRSSSLGRLPTRDDRRSVVGRGGKHINATWMHDTSSDSETWAATEFGGSSEGSSDQGSSELANSNGRDFDERVVAPQSYSMGGGVPSMRVTHLSDWQNAAPTDLRHGNKKPLPAPPSRRREHSLNDSQFSIGENSARSNGSCGVGDGIGGGIHVHSQGMISRSSVRTRGVDTSVSPKSGLESNPTAAAAPMHISTDGIARTPQNNQSKVLSNNSNTNSTNTSINNIKDAGEESMKLKPPSMKGVRPINQPRRGQVNAQFRRSSSADIIPAEASPTTPLTYNETGNGTKIVNSAEYAAMQQLALIVVGLRNELRIVTLARDELQAKLKSNQQREGSNSFDIKLRVLEQENADLQADIDAFIAEQDDLKRELRELHEEKNMLNDLISRLKIENGRFSECSKGSSGNTANRSHVSGSHLDSFKTTTGSVQDMDKRIHFLTEENHNLESELQLLVNEKSELVSSGDSRNCEIQQLRTEAKEAAIRHAEVLAKKDQDINSLQEKIDILKRECDTLENECKEIKADVEPLVGLVAQPDEDLNHVRGMSTLEIQRQGEEITRLQEKVTQVENEKKLANDRNFSLEHIVLGLKKKVEVLLKERDNSVDTFNLNSSNPTLEQATEPSSRSGIASQQQIITEANNVIAMIKDELDRKDVEVKKITEDSSKLQEQLHEAEKSISSLYEQNAKIKSDYDAALDEIDNLLSAKTNGDEEARISIQSEQNKEIQALLNELDEVRRKGNTKVLTLQNEVCELREGKEKLEQDLDESSDAIVVLRETLKEMENGRIARDTRIRELKLLLEEKESALESAESARATMVSEHQVNVDTIATLQKMISSLESAQEDLEEELNASSLAMHDLKDQLKKRNDSTDASDLENKLKIAHEENAKLTERVSELTNVNEKMKNEVKDLGTILSRVSVVSETGLSSSFMTETVISSLVSSDPMATCDALISELKKQIKDIVFARNAAIKEVEMLRSDTISMSEATMPPPSHVHAKRVPTNSAIVKCSSPVTNPGFSKSEQDSDDPSIKTVEKSMTANSSSPSNTGSRGSLLEAAKKLCDQLGQKRTKEDSHRTAITTPTESAWSEDSKLHRVKVLSLGNEERVMHVDDQDDDVESSNEIKEDSPREPNDHVEINAKSPSSSTPTDAKKLSRPRIDIDQMSHIYMEKCGLSRLSDLSTDSSSFRRRIRKPNNISTTAKKVKICRNGVFMGTYEGDLNAEGQRHGCGVLLCDNGNSYEGEWKNDKRDGIGTARYSSGDVYDGQWHRGRRHGHGIMYIEAGDTYIGSWKNGLKHGSGTYHWADGEVDVSWYQDDVRMGEGVRWSANRLKAFRLLRGRKKEELSLDEAFVTAENLGLNLEHFESGIS